MSCLNIGVLFLLWTSSAFGSIQISNHTVATIIAVVCLVNLLYLATNELFWRYGLAPLYDDQHLCYPHMKDTDARHMIEQRQ